MAASTDDDEARRLAELIGGDSDSDEDAEPSGPVDHGTMPMAPIDEPTLAAVAVAHAGR